MPAKKKKITYTIAARLVAAIVAVQECDDTPDTLRVALDDARTGISPFYDED